MRTLNVWKNNRRSLDAEGLYGFGSGAEPVSYTHLDVYKRQYVLRVDYLEDYTADERWRYQPESTEPNRIQVENNEIELNPLETPPELPEDPMEVTSILKSTAEQWGIRLDESMKDLQPDTVVGFAIRPTYDNSSHYAESYTMYAFDEKVYEHNISAMDPTRPLAALKD